MEGTGSTNGPAIVVPTGEVLGLARTEQMLLGQLPRGVALGRVGQSSYLVEHDLSKEELPLADTDGAMRAAGGFPSLGPRPADPVPPGGDVLARSGWRR